MNKVSALNAKGFSLVELVTTMGLMSIFLGVIGFQLHQTFYAINDLEVRQASVDTAQVLSAIFQNDGHCTETLKGLTLNGGAPVPVGDIYLSEADPSQPQTLVRSATPIFSNGSSIGKGATLQQSTIQTIEKVADEPSTYVTRIQFTAADRNNVPFDLPPIHLVLETDNLNRVERCQSITAGGVTVAMNTVARETCSSLSNGEKVFNPQTGQCADRYSVQWFVGTTAQANCPAGQERVPGMGSCGTEEPQGYQDPFNNQRRTFPNGAVQNQFPSHARFITSDTSCQCEYGNDVSDPSIFRCKIQCVDRSNPIQY